MGSGFILIANGRSLVSWFWYLSKPPLMELLNSELENLVQMKVPSFSSVIWEKKKKTFSLAAVRKRWCAGPQDAGVITLPTNAVWCYHTGLWKYHSLCLCYCWMSLLLVMALSRYIAFSQILLKILNNDVELDINLCLTSLNVKLQYFAKISWNKLQ